MPAAWFQTDAGSSYLQAEKLQTSWIEFLERFKFDCWFTLTFRVPSASAGLAIDRASRLIAKVSRRLRIMGLLAFVVAERHSNGTYHCHGLLRLGALSDEVIRMVLTVFWEIAFDMFGRNSFALVRDSCAVRTYVSKYLTKRPADYRFVQFSDFQKRR